MEGRLLKFIVCFVFAGLLIAHYGKPSEDSECSKFPQPLMTVYANTHVLQSRTVYFGKNCLLEGLLINVSPGEYRWSLSSCDQLLDGLLGLSGEITVWDYVNEHSFPLAAKDEDSAIKEFSEVLALKAKEVEKEMLK